MAEETLRCPRRDENPSSDRVYPGPDRWTPPRNPGGDRMHDNVRTCSYCGSMNPDDLMAGIRDQSIELGPTDKNYKAYVHRPLTDEEKAGQRQQQIGRYVGMGMTVEVATEAADKDPVYSGEMLGKFYFQHLPHEQCHEFVDLVNNKTMLIGYPGRFYRLPFFMTRGGGE